MRRGAPLKRTAFARKNNSENTLAKVVQSHASKAQAAIIVAAKSRAVLPASVQAFRGSFPKSQPVRSEAYRRAVASLPCCICGIAGQSQAAHGSGAGTAVCKGMGVKSCDLTCAPVCADRAGVRGCHSRLDQGALFSRAVRHALEPVWAADTQRRVHSMGLWPKGVPYPHDQQEGSAQ